MSDENNFKPLPILDEKSSKVYWRSLEERSGSEDFKKHLETEFPSKHELWNDEISRRDFLKLMGAGLSLMAFSGCRKPIQKIFPYQENPESVIPGKPTFYATVLPFAGYGQGVLVETHEGKPTKIEGNPQHPDSLGSTDVYMQADILGLYDPDRSQSIIYNGIATDWGHFQNAIAEAMAGQSATAGEGLRLLTQTVTSPSMAYQIRSLLKKYPKAKWVQYEPLGYHNTQAGATLAFGQPLQAHYSFDKADVILALDSDFMTSIPGKLRHARAFADGRRLTEGRTTMNRLYVVEPCPTPTGAIADHRLPMRASEIEGFTRYLAGALGVDGADADSTAGRDVQKWMHAVAKDLQSSRGRGLVIAGEGQPPVVHALAHAMNEVLGNAGHTVRYSAPIAVDPTDQIASIKELVADMTEKRAEVLVILGGNPVFDAPADLKFGEALKRVATTVHLSLYEDETSNLCHWHVNEAHPLESWGDLRASDGTVALQQPMIEPLYGGRTALEMTALLAQGSASNSHDLVKDYWKRQSSTLDFENAWKTNLNQGFVPDTAEETRTPVVRSAFSRSVRGRPSQGIEITFRPDLSIWDGRYANNGWLQELPRPISKLTWDNAVLISPATADRLGFKSEDTVELTLDGWSIEGPIWVMPGHADDAVTVHTGYGRQLGGKTLKEAGFSAYQIRTTASMTTGANVQIRKTGRRWELAITQHHHSVEGRDIIRTASLAEYLKNPKFAFNHKDHPTAEETLYKTPEEANEYAWAMSIDMNLCNGCNACVIGCQSENNISIVGKDQVARGREMHWIRIDNYFSGSPEEPEIDHQPLACVHCEDAPCEPVCPPGATMHSDEGLNEMIYNRCIGTRYCSNNCPYKVRRFNFYQYSDYMKEPAMKMRSNPNVTVRERGIMEKCTYCVQRINAAKITAEIEDRQVRDGDIVTACQAACPTQAIAFGNLNDKESRVSRLREEPRQYPILGDLGTRPRTTYLAKVRNRNPDLETPVEGRSA